MIEAKEHYIAYFDVVGYKSLIKHDSLFLEKINKAMLSVMDNFNLMQDFLKLVLNKPDVKIKIFSDNVIIFVEATGNSQIDMINLSTLLYCVKKIQLALMDNAKVFLRGAITKGELYSNDIYIYGSGLVNAVDLENTIAKYPRIIIDEYIIEDSKRLNFDPLEKVDFLTYQLVEDRKKYIRSVKKFLKRIDASLKTGYFFDDFYVCNVLTSLDDIKDNRDNNLENLDFIYNLVHNLSKFFIMNIESFIKIDDDFWFLDYLESHSIKLEDVKRFSSFKEQYLRAEKEAYCIQRNFIEKYPPPKQEDYLKIIDKYNWIREYHNSVAEDFYNGDEDYDLGELLIAYESTAFKL